MPIDWLAANNQEWKPTHGLFVEMWLHEQAQGARMIPQGLSRKLLDQFDSYEDAHLAARDLVRASAEFDDSFTMKLAHPPKWYAVRVLVRKLTDDGAPGKALRSVEILAVPSRPASRWQIIEDAPPVDGGDPSRLHAMVVVHALVEAYFGEEEAT